MEILKHTKTIGLMLIIGMYIISGFSPLINTVSAQTPEEACASLPAVEADDCVQVQKQSPYYSGLQPGEIVYLCGQVKPLSQILPQGDARIENFIDKYGSAALSVASAEGIPVEAMLAQAMHESAFGESELAIEANNYFGIKASGDWTGEVYAKETFEVVNGVTIKIVANFRLYPTLALGFQGYADFIKDPQKTWYQDALGYPNDPIKYLELLQNTQPAGELAYATDPKYVELVTPLILATQSYLASTGIIQAGTVNSCSSSLEGGNFQDTSNLSTTGFPEITRTITKVTGFVLHWTVGLYDEDPEGLVSVLRARKPNGLSVQFYIDQEGNIYQLTPLPHSLAAHACGANSKAIGVEIEGRGPQDLDKQVIKDSVVKLAMYLAGEYPTFDPLNYNAGRSEGILGHYEVAASHTWCDGKSDPGVEFTNYIRDRVKSRILNGETVTDLNSTNTTGGISSCPSTGVSSSSLYTNNCTALSTIINEDIARFNSRKQDRIANGRLIPESSTTTLGSTKIATSAKPAYDNMAAAARADGVTLIPVSGYRSFEEQALQRIEFCSNNGQDLSWQRIFLQTTAGTCSVAVALPGNSNHNGGTAIDFGVDGKTDDCRFKTFIPSGSEQYDWLVVNASTYGFVTIGTGNCSLGGSQEPWHWELR